MSGLSDRCLMHSTKTITMPKFAPNDPAVYNATVGQGGCLTFCIKMPWVRQDADLSKPFDPYIEDHTHFTTPFATYSGMGARGSNWFEINDAPACVWEHGIAVQEITIKPLEGVQPGPYALDIGRIIHYRQMGACDTMYKIRRHYTYANAVVCVKGAAECTCRR